MITPAHGLLAVVDLATGRHWILLVCALAATVALIWLLSIMLVPRTSRLAVAGAAVFFLVWLVETVARAVTLVASIPIADSPSLIWVLSASVIVGFVLSLVGIVLLTRNPHRYSRGFGAGLLGAMLNGWVVAHSLGGVAQTEGSRTLILPAFEWLGEQKDTKSLDELLNRLPDDLSAVEVPDHVVRALAKDLTRLLRITAGWKEMPAAEDSPSRAVHPDSQVLLFSAEGPTWMSVSVHRRWDLDQTRLGTAAESAVFRVKSLAADFERRGSSRNVIAGFDVARLRYSAILPQLPGRHSMDQWVAIGAHWMVEIVMWTPAATEGRFEQDCRQTATSMLRVAGQRGLSGKPRDPRAERLFESGNQAWSDHNSVQALSDWSKAIDLCPSDAELVLCHVRGLDSLGQTEDALRFLRSRRDFLAPDQVLSATEARLLVLTGQPGAETLYNELAARSYADDSAFQDRLASLAKERRYADASDVLDRDGSRHSKALVDNWRAYLLAATTTPATPPVRKAEPEERPAAALNTPSKVRPAKALPKIR